MAKNESTPFLQPPSNDDHPTEVIEIDTLLQHNNAPEPDNKTKLLNAAEKGDWKKVFQIITAKPTLIIGAVDPSSGRTILHCACEQKSNRDATETVRKILIKAGRISTTELLPFLDKGYTDPSNPKGGTEQKFAIQIAAERKNRELVKLLIDNGADVNLPKNGGDKEAIRIIYQHMPKVIWTLLERNLKLKENPDDPSEETQIVEYDFTPITGVLAQNKEESKIIGLLESQTFLLSTALHEKRIKRSEVLLHPLVQLFLYYKNEKFTWWIFASMAYHIIWSVVCILFIVALAKFPDVSQTNDAKPCTCIEDQLTTDTDTWSTTEAPQPPVENTDTSGAVWNGVKGIIPLPALIFWAVTCSKEIIEMRFCPNRIYYLKQLENWGQWILIFIIPGIYFENEFVSTLSATTGILIAGSLVLGQFNKTELLGIYMEMLVKVMKNISKFFLFFSPIMITFAIIFRLLMPGREEFWFPSIVKVVSMMTGEIGYDDVFHDDEKGEVPLPLLTKIVFLCFVVTVIFVLQNLLIGLSISEIQELTKKAKENHIAKQLEQIYLIETFLIPLFRKIGRRDYIEKLMVKVKPPKTTTLEDLPEKLQEVIWKAVQENPNRFKEIKYDNATKSSTNSAS